MAWFKNVDTNGTPVWQRQDPSEGTVFTSYTPPDAKGWGQVSMGDSSVWMSEDGLTRTSPPSADAWWTTDPYQGDADSVGSYYSATNPNTGKAESLGAFNGTYGPYSEYKKLLASNPRATWQASQKLPGEDKSILGNYGFLVPAAGALGWGALTGALSGAGAAGGVDAALTSGFNSGVAAGNAGGLALAGPTEAAAGSLGAGAGGLQVGAGAGLGGLGELSAGGLGAGLATGGTGLATGAGAGLGSLGELSAGGLGAGLATGGLGAQLGATGAAIGTAAAGGLGIGAGGGGAGAAGIGGTAVSGAGTALSRILNGTATASDYADLALKAAPGVISAIGSNSQSNALTDLAKQQMAFGAPSRGRFEASMSPGFDPTTIPGYSGALSNTSDAVLRALSTKGNPFGNPGGLIEANKAIVNGTAMPAIQNYQQQNSQAGGFGSINAAAPQTSLSAIGANNNTYSDLGSAFKSVTNPTDTSSFDQFLKSIASKGLSNFGGFGT